MMELDFAKIVTGLASVVGLLGAYIAKSFHSRLKGKQDEIETLRKDLLHYREVSNDLQRILHRVYEDALVEIRRRERGGNS